MQKTLLVSFVLLASTLGGCGGGGDDTTTQPIQSLQGPQQVSIVDADASTALALRLPRSVRGVAGSDYESDQTRFWMRDSSMSVLDTVNMILSSLQQTKYWQETNQGPYRALVESTDGDDRGRGNQGPSYEEWVVNSVRANNESPQIVSFWISGVEEGEESVIYGRLTVTASPSDTDPLGTFTLHFKSLEDDEPSTSTETQFEGYMRTVARTDGQSEVEFYMGHGDPDGVIPVGESAQRQRVRVVANRGAGTGRAYAERREAQNQGSSTFLHGAEYQLQFNRDYVARRDVANGNELAVLDRNDFDTRVHRYGVYDSVTEARVEQRSGFPVQDAEGNNGWAGFHGVWFQDNVELTNGQTLYRRSFRSGATTPYTLVIAPGRLEKRTRSQITLGDVRDEDLEYFRPIAGGELRVRFTGTDIVKTAERHEGEWQPVTPPVSIASTFTAGQWVRFWSPARGSVELTWPATLNNTAPAFLWTSVPMNADAPELAGGDLTLHGYIRQLRAAITSNQANYRNSESPYWPDASTVNEGNRTYVFDRETLVLTLTGVPVTLGEGVVVEQGPGVFGFHCGPLFANPLTSMQSIQDQSTTYEWTTGQQQWNQLRTLRDAAGAYAAFDPPTRLTYVHAEPGSTFDQRTFFLHWDGTNLGGLPYERGEDGRYTPLLNIPTGATATAGARTLKIKQLEGERRMVEVNDPETVYEAQGFDLDEQVIAAPTAAPYQDPAIGAKPTVTEAPRYVGGISQATSDS